MLFDPFEEQLHLPARLVEVRDGEGRKVEVVGQKDEPAALVQVVESDASEWVRIVLDRGRRGERDSMIGPQACGLADGPRVASSQQDAGFGACDKERTATMQDVETLEVQIAPIHHVEGASFRQNLVQEIHVMPFSVGNLNKSGNRATQV